MQTGTLKFFDCSKGFGYARIGSIDAFRVTADRYVEPVDEDGIIYRRAQPPKFRDGEYIDVIAIKQHESKPLEAFLWTANTKIALSAYSDIRYAPVKFYRPAQYGFLLRVGDEDLYIHANDYRALTRDHFYLHRVPENDKPTTLLAGTKVGYVEVPGRKGKMCASPWFLAP